MSTKDSGSSTPLSSSTTNLGSPTVVKGVNFFPFDNASESASSVIEFVASREGRSSLICVYDVAEQLGFGTLSKQWARTTSDASRIVDVQTRAGAGLSLVGWLNHGTAREITQGDVLTAYTTPSGLALMAPSFQHIPQARSSRRLVIQVPTATPIGQNLALSPTLASLAHVWSILPSSVAIFFSSKPQQAVDFATIAYQLTDTHVVHFFDYHSTCREVGHSITPLQVYDQPTLSIRDAFSQSGHSFFEYYGHDEATSIVVLLNGSLALSLKSFINSGGSVGVIIVNVFRPWDEAAFRSVVPPSAMTVHVLDDVPSTVTQGSLYNDVFGSLCNSSPKPFIHSHHILPSQTQIFLSQGEAFSNFIQRITGAQITSDSLNRLKKLLMFNTPTSPLSALPHFLQQLFALSSKVKARLLEDLDLLSKSGGITASRLLVSRSDVDLIPIPFSIPLGSPSVGHSDFLVILDQGLLKTHSLLQHAQPGSIVLVVSSWTNEEFLANLPSSAISLIRERRVSIYLIDVQAIVTSIAGTKDFIQEAVQNLLAELAILRLYLGNSGTEETVLQIARSSFAELIGGIPLEKYNALAWSSLRRVEFPFDVVIPDNTPSLKDFEPNAVMVEANDGSMRNGARSSTWHEAAKHFIFSPAFAPKMLSNGDHKKVALRPEVQDQTFLVTCTVNRRLTPLEYDRNVFHLEFDTSGTGLKYNIGEALGIYGWNDEQEILDFCDWYGVDPHCLITIPVPGDDVKLHTRTVFQALQQQIDIFGKPPKSFYSDLAEFATTQVDRYALNFIGSPEGSQTFKKLSEKDTVTYADVLRLYPSARPNIERLCEMIGDIKPRHYSIASSQSVVGDRVDLLVVTVEWVTPSGKFQRVFLSSSHLSSRRSTLRSMYSLPCWIENWAKSIGFNKTKCHEG